jgi:hypothetical protein
VTEAEEPMAEEVVTCGDDEQRLLGLEDRLEQRKDLLEHRDLLVGDEDARLRQCVGACVQYNAANGGGGSAPLEAARSSSRGGSGAPSGPGLSPLGVPSRPGLTSVP